MIALTDQQIEQSPFQSVGDLFRNVPRPFAGGQNVTVVQAGGRGSASSYSFISTPNLQICREHSGENADLDDLTLDGQ